MRLFNFRIHKHGNKHTLTIPAEFMRTNGLNAGDTLILTIKENMPYKIIVHSFGVNEIELNYYRLKRILS